MCFLLSGFEQLLMVTGQIALTVLIWNAVAQKKRMYYPLAIVLHALLSSVYFYAAQQMDGKRLATDAVLLVISIVVIAVARLLQKSETGMHTGVPQTN